MVCMSDEGIVLLRALFLAALFAIPAATLLARAMRRAPASPLSLSALIAVVAPGGSRRDRIAWACMGGAVAAAGLAMAFLSDPGRAPGEGLLFLAASLALFLAAAALRRPELPAWPGEIDAKAVGVPGRRERTVRAALALSGVAAILALSIALQHERLPHVAQLGAWSAGVALFIAGATPPRAWRSAWGGLAASWRAHPREWLFVVGCTGLALALRLFRLESAIPYLFLDEAFFARDAAFIAEGGRASIFAPAHEGQPWVLAAMQAPFVGALGRTLAAIRLPSALMGALSLPPTYLLARQLFDDRRVAAAATFFLAAYPVHMQFSRLAINNIFDLFGVWAMALLLLGLRRGGRVAFAFAGVTLALSQYFHTGGRMYLVLTALILLYLVAARRDWLRARWRGLAVTLSAAALTACPYFYHLMATGFLLNYRASKVSLFFSPEGRQFLEWASEGEGVGAYLVEQFSNAYLAFIHTPDRVYFYGGRTAMLLPPAAAAFLLGVMWLLWRWRRPAEALLLAWIGLTALLGGALVTFSPGYARYVVALPAVAVATALGVVWTLDYLAPALRLRRVAGDRRRLANGLAVVVIAALAVVNVDYYFGRHLADFQRDFGPRPWQLIDVRERVRALPPGVKFHVISWNFEIQATLEMGFFHPGRAIQYHNEEHGVDWRFIDVLEPGTHVFFVSPYQLQDLETLVASLPGGEFHQPPYQLQEGEPYLEYWVRVER